MDSTGGDPMGGDPFDLDADRPGLSREDATLAAAFRSGLEPDEGQARRVIARLPLIQAQARRSHRRRKVLAAGVAVVAVAAATALVSALPATPVAGRATPAGTPSAAPTKRYVLPPTVLLPTQAVRAFGNARLLQSDGPRELGGQDLVAGVCVDTSLRVKAPDHGWETAWSVAEPPADAIVPAGLVEKVWRWSDAKPATSMFQQLEDQVADCSAGPGLEGRGVTSRLDTPPELSQADSVLATAASDGQGNQAIQVVMRAGQVVVQLDAVIPKTGKDKKGTGELALWKLAPTAQAALTRAIDVTEEAAR